MVEASWGLLLWGVVQGFCCSRIVVGKRTPMLLSQSEVSGGALQDPTMPPTCPREMGGPVDIGVESLPGKGLAPTVPSGRGLPPCPVSAV